MSEEEEAAGDDGSLESGRTGSRLDTATGSGSLPEGFEDTARVWDKARARERVGAGVLIN
jgi:hypothetical protein